MARATDRQSLTFHVSFINHLVRQARGNDFWGAGGRRGVLQLLLAASSPEPRYEGVRGLPPESKRWYSWLVFVRYSAALLCRRRGRRRTFFGAQKASRCPTYFRYRKTQCICGKRIKFYDPGFCTNLHEFTTYS